MPPDSVHMTGTRSPSHEVMSESVGGKTGRLLESARFLEQMRRSGNQPELLLALKERIGHPVQLYDAVVASADDE
jgi:hypothetical protein